MAKALFGLLSFFVATSAFGVKIKVVKKNFVVVVNDPGKAAPAVGDKFCSKGKNTVCGKVVKVRRWYSAVKIDTAKLRPGQRLRLTYRQSDALLDRQIDELLKDTVVGSSLESDVASEKAMPAVRRNIFGDFLPAP